MSSTLMQGVLEGLRANAEAFVHPDEDFAPVLFLETKTGVTVGDIGGFFENDETKEQFAKHLPAIIRREKPERVVLLVSAYAIQASEDYMTNDEPRPSEHPDRVELVMVTEMTKDGVGEVVTAYIDRDPFGIDAPRLSEFSHDLDGEGKTVDGRFVNPIIETLKEIHHA